MKYRFDRANLPGAGPSAQAPAAPPPAAGPAWSPEIERLVRQADAAFVAGEYVQAASYLAQALELAPEDTQLINALGNLLLRAGDVSAAELQFVKATVLHPNDPAAFSNLAPIRLHQDQLDQAEADARQALALQPDNQQAQTVLDQVAQRRRDASAPARVADQPAIYWNASIFDFSGYAWLSRQALPAVLDRGLNLQVQSLTVDPAFMEQLQKQPQNMKLWKQLVSQRVTSGVGLFFHPPVSWQGENFFAKFRDAAPGFNAYVALTMWETDRLPRGWTETLNTASEVWVPCAFNREVFAASGVNAAKLQVIPFGLNAAQYDPALVQPMQLQGSRGFNFLSVFQWNKRKGWDILLKAYLSAFTADDDVCLHIRAYPDRTDSTPIQQRINAYVRQLGYDPARIPAIQLIREFVSESQMPALYAAADAFVLPTRGEGWGIPFMEAMASAKPVIATRWSGHLDFMNDANSYLIDVERLEPVDADQQRDNPFYTPDQRWAQPSLEHAAALMRRVYDNRAESAETGRRARDHIAANWTLANTADWIVTRTAELVRARPAGPAPAPAPRPMAVNWHAPVFDASGYADDARGLVQGLDRRGMAVRLNSASKPSAEFVSTLDPASRIELERLLQTPVAPPFISVIHTPAYAFDRDPRASYNIGRTMFETDRLPPEWVTACNRMDEIWVPTEFNRGTFAAAGVSVPVVRIPMGMDSARYRPGLPKLDALAGLDGFKFLSVFEWSYRKGWDILLKAWAEAFTPDSGARLILRTSPMGQTDPARAKSSIEQFIASFYATLGIPASRLAPIHVIPQVPLPQLPQLYAAADAFVLPSRGEGWGRPYMEAMSTGLPVIGTRWSGNLEFMNDGNSLLIDVDGLEEVGDAEELKFYRGHRWARPSAAHLVQLLRQVRADPAAGRALGERARREIVERWSWESAAQVALSRLNAIGATPAAPRAPAQVKVRWQGSQFAHSSLALINREICLRLAQDPNVDLAIAPCEPNAFKPDIDPRFGLIAERINKDLAGTEVHVRHQWPPDLTPPPDGRWVMMQPWEFGSLPREWVKAMNTQVDEVWVPSAFVRDTCIASGVTADRVKALPNGVDPQTFNPAAAPMKLSTAKTWKFLFVGGTIWRKGFDLLLEAYRAAFSAADDVCLVVKDMGTATFYAGRNAADLLRDFRADPHAPEILYIDADMPPASLPGLYTACDCLVHPYRGEGFGLPIAEGMACGLPVIVTGAGACLDYCDAGTAYLIPARRVDMPANRVGDHETAGTPFTYEPDVNELGRLMRAVRDNPGTARAVGARAAQHIAANFTWDHLAGRVVERLSALRSQPIRRFTRAADLPAETESRPPLLVAAAGGDSGELWRALPHSMPGRVRVITPLTPEHFKRAPGELSLETTQQSLNDLLKNALEAPGDEPIVLVSSDVVVTPGWFERLTSLVSGTARIGLAGPIANSAPATQRIKAKYDGLGKGLRQFAKQRSYRQAKVVRSVEYLGGFCLAFNRQAARAAGGWRCDVDFEAALWDFMARLKAAGYQLAAAEDVYVHHSDLSAAEGLEYDGMAAMEAKVHHAFTEGEAALQANHAGRAQAIFEELTATYPEVAGGWAALGAVQLSQGDGHAAAVAFGRALAISPDNSSWQNQLGVSYFRLGSPEKAEEAFQEALAIDVENVDALLNLVELHRSQDRYAEAAEYMKRAVSRAPDNADVLTAFGQLGLELGDIEAALMAIRNIERVAPGHPALQALKEATAAHAPA